MIIESYSIMLKVKYGTLRSIIKFLDYNTKNTDFIDYS